MATSAQLPREQHPRTPRPPQTIDGPWLADRRWGAGRIGDSAASGMLAFWGFAILWNAIAMPAIYLAIQHVREDRPQGYLVFLFPLVGLGLLACAGYATLRYVTHGRSWLELETLPGCVGGWLAGHVRTSATLSHAEMIELSLRCVRRVTTGSGKRRKTRENTVWCDDQALTAARLPGDRNSGDRLIPVAFRIPPDLPETLDSPHDDIIWRLRVRAAMAGTDYAADFDVPVFHARQPDGYVPRAEDAAARVRASRAALAAFDDPQIHVSTNAAGRTRLVFPASRNRGTAALMAVVCLIAAGVAAGTAAGGAPRLVPVIAGVVAVPLAYAAALYAFRHVELLVDRHAIERHWRMLGFAGSRTIATGDVVEVTKKVTAEANETPYHTVYAVVQGGREVPLVSNLRARDAQHVVEEIVNALGSGAAAARP